MWDLILVLGFLGVLSVAFLPSLVEGFKRRDSQPLPIDSEYVRDPRFFGRSFRDKLHSHIPAELLRPLKLQIQLNRRETLFLAPQIKAPPLSSTLGIAVSFKPAYVGEDSVMGEVYLRSGGAFTPRVTVNAVASDGNLHLGAGCTVRRWVDVEGDLLAEEDTNLGVSTSASSMYIKKGCKFQRLWGMPILTGGNGNVEPQIRATHIGNSLIWAGKRMVLPSGIEIRRDMVIRGDLTIGEDAVIEGSLQVYGHIWVGAGVKITGNLFAQKSIHLEPNTHILGHVRSEGKVTAVGKSIIGEPSSPRTLYGKRVLLGSQVQVWGSVLAEHGGSVGD